MISRVHAEAVMTSDGGYLVGVTDKSIERASAFAKEHGCAVFEDAEKLLDCDDIDVVCICTPSGLHAEYAVKAARAGKHFVVEKPMAITKEGLERIASACEENGVKGCVISQMRFSPVVRTVKRAIDDGLLGRILYCDCIMKYYRSKEYYSSSSWKGTFAMDGGGALMNQGIHGVDLVLHLLGDVKAVNASCTTLLHDIEVEDFAELILEYEGGASGHVIATTAAYPGYPLRIEISGTRGTVAFTENSILCWDVEGSKRPSICGDDSGNATYSDPTRLGADYHRVQINDMIRAVTSKSSPLVDINEGRRSVSLVLAAYESCRCKRKTEV